MDNPVINTISLCSGVGMLDVGLADGLEYLGIRSRCILYAEREAYPCAVLESRMEERSLDAAPIFCGDFTRLDGRQFRGVVDAIVAGFPCQDLSVAGNRVGLDGKRSGLFFAIADFADSCGARYLFLENVSGIASATATVMGETEELEERATARVLGELADRGWDAEWLTISASEVGASHGRARWFCFAWRPPVDDTGSRALRHDCKDKRPAAGEVNETSGAGGLLGNAECARWRTGRGGHSFHPAKESEQGSGTLADTCQQGSQRDELGNPCDRNGRRKETHGSAPEFCGLFALGPSDPRWADIIKEQPECAPALEPDFRGMVDGLAFAMDESRAARLKCIGNGVVPLQAAVAAVALIERSGILTR